MTFFLKKKSSVWKSWPKSQLRGARPLLLRSWCGFKYGIYKSFILLLLSASTAAALFLLAASFTAYGSQTSAPSSHACSVRTNSRVCFLRTMPLKAVPLPKVLIHRIRFCTGRQSECGRSQDNVIPAQLGSLDMSDTFRFFWAVRYLFFLPDTPKQNQLSRRNRSSEWTAKE